MTYGSADHGPLGAAHQGEHPLGRNAPLATRVAVGRPAEVLMDAERVAEAEPQADVRGAVALRPVRAGGRRRQEPPTGRERLLLSGGSRGAVINTRGAGGRLSPAPATVLFVFSIMIGFPLVGFLDKGV